ISRARACDSSSMRAISRRVCSSISAFSFAWRRASSWAGLSPSGATLVSTFGVAEGTGTGVGDSTDLLATGAGAGVGAGKVAKVLFKSSRAFASWSNAIGAAISGFAAGAGALVTVLGAGAGCCTTGEAGVGAGAACFSTTTGAGVGFCTGVDCGGDAGTGAGAGIG